MSDDTKIYFADLESTGLLHHLIEQGDKAKLHNFCAMSVDGKNMWTLHTDTDNERKTLQRFLDRDIILVMHNGIQYDKYALKHFGYNVDKVHFVDFEISDVLYLKKQDRIILKVKNQKVLPFSQYNDFYHLNRNNTFFRKNMLYSLKID